MKPICPRKPGPLLLPRLITNEKPFPFAFHASMSPTELMTGVKSILIPIRLKGLTNQDVVV
jgi:hypothetical protein